MRRRIGLLIFVAVGASWAFGSAPASSVEVQTGSGTVAGVASGDGAVISFKGIPYAAPPVGTLRWRAPEAAKAWSGVRKSDQFGSSCMQGPNTEFGPWTKEFLYVTPPSEDCLYLNIWSPKASASAKLPVLVYIYGGGFTSGSGDVPVYDGEALAKSGMVIVTINYRVGPFGFLALPALTAESEHHSSGDYGLLDQIAALRWVKENIRAFGGDPARVAIAGQSAGAMSVADLVASPLTKGLFSAAIADSGIGGRGVPVKTLAEAEKAGEAFAASKKADSLAALRAMRAEDLLAAPGTGLRFAPVVDGWVLPDDPLTLTTERGRDNDVPVITGFQANDFLLGSRAGSTADYEKDAHQTYGTMADEFLKLYPAVTDDAVKAAVAESGRDRMRARAYWWASHRTQTHKSAVYLYYFDRAIPWPAHPEWGAFHTGEIPYAFGNLKVLDRPWEPVDFQVSKMMMAYWKNMAERGDPNGDGEPRWAKVSPGTATVMRLGADSGPMPAADAVKLDFWKRYFASAQSKTAPVF